MQSLLKLSRWELQICTSLFHPTCVFFHSELDVDEEKELLKMKGDGDLDTVTGWQHSYLYAFFPSSLFSFSSLFRGRWEIIMQLSYYSWNAGSISRFPIKWSCEVDGLKRNHLSDGSQIHSLKWLWSNLTMFLVPCLSFNFVQEQRVLWVETISR